MRHWQESELPRPGRDVVGQAPMQSWFKLILAPLIVIADWKKPENLTQLRVISRPGFFSKRMIVGYTHGMSNRLGNQECHVEPITMDPEYEAAIT